MSMRHIIKYSLAWRGNDAFIRRSFGWHVKLFLFESKVKILENSYNSMCYDYICIIRVVQIINTYFGSEYYDLLLSSLL